MNKNELLSKLIHDCLSPLVPLSGYLQLLEDDLKDAGVQIDYYDQMLSSCEKVENKIQELRTEVKKLLE